LWEEDLCQGDVIRIEVKTSLVSKGPDENRTMDLLYEVDEDAAVKEIVLNKVGHPRIPILKGKVRELANVTEADKREAEIDTYLQDGFDDDAKPE